MNIRMPVRDGGGPFQVGAIVFAVVVAVNLAAGPEALEGSFTRAVAAGGDAIAVVRRAADLAIRYGAEEGDDDARPPETCPPSAKPHRRAGPMKARTCEIEVRCSASGAAVVARPWVCRSRS
jgi:hypothetical protein